MKLPDINKRDSQTYLAKKRGKPMLEPDDDGDTRKIVIVAIIILLAIASIVWMREARQEGEIQPFQDAGDAR
jgi:hypothetical protein